MAPAGNITKFYPSLVAFDLDGTVWKGWLNEQEYGKKGWVTDSSKKEDNVMLALINADKQHVIKDKLNLDHKSARVIVAKDLISIIQDLRKNKVTIAIASKNTNRNMCLRALYHIKFKDPVDGKEKPLTKVIKYCEVGHLESKVTQFQNFQGWSKMSCKTMLLFDDKAENMDVEQWTGAAFFKIDNREKGITWKDYQHGLQLYRAYQSWRFMIPEKGINSSRVRHIGYVGADKVNAERYANGMRRTKTDRSARWGFGMYVADDPNIAIFFAKSGRAGQPENQWVVRLYVRDYMVFKQWMEKVWLPEKDSWQIDNQHLDQAATAERQAQLDEKVMRNFKVTKPYVAFCKHHYMSGMTFLEEGTRFNELVLYPQVQDALFFGVAYPIAVAQAKVAANDANWRHLKWHRNVENWGIKLIAESL